MNNSRKLSRRTALALMVTAPVIAQAQPDVIHRPWPTGRLVGKNAVVTFVYKPTGEWIRLIPVPYTNELVEE